MEEESPRPPARSAALLRPLQNLPSASRRGGDYNEGNLGGTFSFYLDVAPSYSQNSMGFRCLTPR